MTGVIPSVAALTSMAGSGVAAVEGYLAGKGVEALIDGPSATPPDLVEMGWAFGFGFAAGGASSAMSPVTSTMNAYRVAAINGLIEGSITYTAQNPVVVDGIQRAFDYEVAAFYSGCTYFNDYYAYNYSYASCDGSSYSFGGDYMAYSFYYGYI